MDEGLLQSTDSTRGEGLPGARHRRRRSRRRKLLRLLEPFLLLGALAVLSTGVVKVVETRVPTKADQHDERRPRSASADAHEQAHALAASIERGWMPSPRNLEAELFGEPLALDEDPWIGLADPDMAAGPSDAESADQLPIEISSTSKTSAAPPGMLGGEPLSP